MAYEFNENKKVIVIAHPAKQEHYYAIKAKNPYLDMEIMDLRGLKALFDYQYDDRALFSVMREGYGYKVSRDILQALTARNYENGIEVKQFDQIRNDLISKGYLFKTPYPEKTFQDVDILVSGYYSEDEVIKGYLGDVELIHDEDDLYENPTNTYLSFKDVYEELHYVFNQIAFDLDSGTPINKIFVYGIDDDYIALVNQFSKYYGFEIAMEFTSRLFDINAYKVFRMAYLTSGLEAAIDIIRDSFPTLKDVDTIERLARRFEQVYPGDKEKSLAVFDEIAKTKSKYVPYKKNVVRVLKEAICPPDGHLYCLNFSMGIYPKAPSQGGYFSDEEKERMGLDTAVSLSRRDSGIVEHALKSKTLKLITFSEEVFGNQKFECAFKDKYNMNVIKNPRSWNEYAKDQGAFLCANLQDQKRKYLQEDARRSVYEDITGVSLNYPTYDNSFKGKKLGRQKGRRYSYSSLHNYIECPFKYLLINVLGLDEFKGNLGASIGKIFHGTFEQYYKNRAADFETAFDNAMKIEQGLMVDPDNNHHEVKTEFNDQEKAIINNLKNYCKISFDFQLKYEKYLQNAAFLPEKDFEFTLDNGIKINGRYDKITQFEYNGKKYSFVIDYKTNDERFNEKLLRNFGLSLQLPIYALAIEKDNGVIGDSTLAGLFISPILNFKLTNEKGVEIASADQEGLRLAGVYLNDPNLFLKIDPLMSPKSSYIEGMTFDEKKGIFKKSTAEFQKYKTEEEIKELADIAESKIKELDERITNGDFKIDPLNIKGNCTACQYCEFHDVCYVDKKKIKTLSINGEVTEDEENENGEI